MPATVPQDLSEEDLERTQHRLDSEVFPKLGADMPDLSENVGRLLRRPNDEVRILVEQHLEDLGYLKEGSRSASEDAFFRAIVRWRADERALHARYFEVNLSENINNRSRIFEKLSAQVDLHKNIEFTALPIAGQQSLASRIIHFRLKTLGVFRGKVTLPFGAKSVNGLKAVARLLQWQNENMLSVANGLGDIEKLTQRLVEVHPDWIYVFKLPAKETLQQNGKMPSEFKWLWDHENQEYQFLSISRKARGSARVGGNHRGRRHTRLPSQEAKGHLQYEDDPVNELSAEAAAKKKVNKLGLQILQVQLWSLGYYQGEIDGDWGSMSLKASAEFLKTYQSKTLKRFFCPLKDDYLAVNLGYVFNELIPEAAQDMSRVQIQDVDTLSTDLFEHCEDWESLDETHQKIQGQETQLYQNTKKRRRRLFGLRSIFCAVGRFIKKAVGAVFKALKKLATAAVRIFKYGLSKITKAVRLVGLSVRRFYYWFTCKPFITTDPQAKEIVMTRASRDGDTVFFASPGASRKLMERHQRLLMQMRYAFRLVVRIALKAIEIARMAVMQNWLFLAWSLFKLFRSDTWEEWKVMYQKTLPLPV